MVKFLKSIHFLLIHILILSCGQSHIESNLSNEGGEKLESRTQERALSRVEIRLSYFEKALTDFRPREHAYSKILVEGPIVRILQKEGVFEELKKRYTQESEILEQLAWHPLVLTRWQALRSFTQAMSLDKAVKVSFGNWFSYDFKENRIRVPFKEILEYPLNPLLGIMLEEAGHNLFSRWPAGLDALPLSEFQKQALLIVNNKVEDVRVWTLQSFRLHGDLKGALFLFEEAYDFEEHVLGTNLNTKIIDILKQNSEEEITEQQKEKIQQIPLQSEKFLSGIWYRWRHDSLDNYEADTEVLEALKEVEPSLDNAINLPPKTTEKDLENVKWVDLQAQKSFEIIKEKIFPVYLKFLKEDGQSLSQALSKMNIKLKPSASGEGPEGAASLIIKAKEQQKGDLKKPSKAQQGKDAENGKDSQATPGELKKLEMALNDALSKKEHQEGEYKKFILEDFLTLRADVAPYIYQLSQFLRTTLLQNSKKKVTSRPSENGTVLSISDIIRAEAQYERTGFYPNDIWLRQIIPTKRDYHVIMVLDRSGSITGQNEHPNSPNKSVLKTSILVSEALENIKIPETTIGFSEDCELMKSCSEKSNLEKRKQTFESLSKYGGGGTNDIKSMELAWQNALKHQGRNTKTFIIFVTDGMGRQKEMIEFIKKHGSHPDIHIVGVGIGDGMKQVKDVFENFIVVPEVKNLPVAIATFMKKAIGRR